MLVFNNKQAQLKYEDAQQIIIKQYPMLKTDDDRDELIIEIALSILLAVTCPDERIATHAIKSLSVGNLLMTVSVEEEDDDDTSNLS